MNPHILNKEVQAFLEEHKDSDLDRLIFKGSPFENVSIRELAEQIQARRKCRSKLPKWYETPGIVFPGTLNIEQSSSEKAALYKALLVKGERMIDLTGGFGVDSYYFSSKFDRVVHVEKNGTLQEIVRHNFKILHIENVDWVNDDSMEYLKKSDVKFDWAYVDPSRRDSVSERVFRLEDCTPNLIENFELITSKSQRVLLKLAPFLDISKALKQLNNVSEVQVLAIENEVKELLFIIERTPSISVKIKAVNILRDRMDVVQEEFGVNSPITFGEVSNYLYEPNPAIRKAGLYSTLGKEYNLTKVHPNSHLFTGEELVDFPGRVFTVRKQINYNPKRLKKELGVEKANITTRNFHESVAEIRKRTRIKEGGEDYLFFTTDHQSKSIVIHCHKA